MHMKKHLFLFILTLAVLSVSNVWAGTIDFLTNPNSYTLYTENASLSGSSIISGKNWCVYGWDLSGEDCSSWESFTVTYDNTVPGGGIKCLYDDSSQEWADINRYGNNPTSATISFNRSKTISKVFVQVEGSGQTLTLNSAYITFEDPIDPCAMTTIQCETYNSSLFTSSRKTENSETHDWVYPDGEMIQNNSDGKEFFYYVELPEDANYTFKIHTSTQRSQNFKIYSLTGEGSDEVGYGGQTYYQKGSSTNVNASYESWNDYYAAPNAPTISLSKGKYVIGLSCNSYARFDKIVIVADDEVFCDPACTKHAVTLAAGANGYVSGGGDYCEGASVTVTATPETSYRFVNWTYTSTGAEASTDAEYTFTLSADISLTANFEEDPCTNTKTVQCVSGYVPVTIHDHANPYVENKHETYVVTTSGNNVSAYYYPLSFSTTISSFTLSIHMANSQYDYAWFNLYKKTANDNGDVEYDGAYYNKVGWQHMVSSGSWNSNEFDDAITSFADGSEGVGSSIPSGDYLLALSAKNDARFYYFTLTTSENIFCPNTITMAKSGDDGAAAPTASPSNTAMAGVEVTVTAGAPSANHYFSGWTVSPGNAVTFANQTNATTTFVMPAEDVTITANYGEVVSSKFTYTTSGSGSITCNTPSDSNVNSGTTISMTAVPSDDYVFTGWTTTAGTFGDEYAPTTTFTMPAVAATVTANFAQVDNVIVTGGVTTISDVENGGDATMVVTSVSDFDAFNHNVLKFAYSNMSGKYKGQKVAIDAGYSSASSAGATGFGFYYKTEKADDNVAFCFDTRYGQVKWELQATNNVWKYYYFAHAGAAGWDRGGIIIYMNGDDGGNHTTYKNDGAFYMSEIAATSITSKPDIKYYHYTNNRGGLMAVNDYGTLCLPMDGIISGATLYSVAGKETGGDISYLVLEDQGTNVVAGKPYITQSTATSYTVTMSGAHSAVQDGNGLVGTYELINPLTPYNESGPHNYFLYANAFKKAGTGVTVGAYRAYLNWDEVSAPAPAPSARRIRMVIEGQEVETGMETVTAMPKTTKVLIDGQLFIIREGKRYTLTGARAQ